MGIGGFSSSKPPLAKLMAFIDGGYLREQCKRKIGADSINFEILKKRLEESFNANCGGKYKGDLVRIYYYDAIVDIDDPDFQQQDEFFSKINSINGYKISLGRLIRTGDKKDSPLKQKGVDIQLAIDMLSMAYQEHYEFALLVAGDNDFFDLVEAVQDSNRRVFGFYFREHVSEELLNSFDAKIAIDNFVNDLKTITV